MTPTPEIVERVRSGYDALNATGEWPADGLLGARFTLHQDPFVDDGRTFHGPGAPGELMRAFGQSFSDVSVVVEDIVPASDDRLVAIIAIRGRGKASGTAIDKRQGHVWSVVAGEATEMQIHGQPSEALKAVGLEEGP